MWNGIGRRRVLVGAVALAGWRLRPAPALSQSFSCPAQRELDVSRFESGDLLFPKTPGRLIPFNDGAGETEAEAWQRGRTEVIAELEALPTPTADEQVLLAHLQSLDRSFAEFKAVYEQGHDPEREQLRPFGGSAVDPREHSGHVAIVQVTGGEPLVIEAVGSGVQRISFAQWRAKRQSERVWHMQVKAPTRQRHEIARIAATFVGRPYSLMSSVSSFRLDDTRTFYCSKLAWLSVMTSCGFALDGNSKTARVWPVSPLTLANSDRLAAVVSQGDYKAC